jgi:hypothetical protein
MWKKIKQIPKLEIKKVAPQNSKTITLMIDHVAIAFDNLSQTEMLTKINPKTLGY